MSGLLKSTIFALVFSLVAVSFVHAQGLPGISQPVTFQIVPDFPAPGDTVTVSAQSYSTDLNRADFSWYVDGKPYKKGTGVTNVSVVAKKNTSTTISVDVTTADIGVFSNSVTIHPADVTLLWQTDGYTPPFYQGKSLETYGSAFKVTAVPEFLSANGKRANPKTLIYTWKKNGTVDAAQSGYGKDSFTSTQSSYVRGGDDVSVEVSNVAGNMTAMQTITLSPAAAELLFYRDSPLYGLQYEQALPANFDLTDQEITVKVEPFNISTSNPLSGALSFDWLINGTAVPSFQNKDEITLRKVDGITGQSQIGVTIQHQNRILQGGQASITISQ